MEKELKLKIGTFIERGSHLAIEYISEMEKIKSEIKPIISGLSYSTSIIILSELLNELKEESLKNIFNYDGEKASEAI